MTSATFWVVRAKRGYQLNPGHWNDFYDFHEGDYLALSKGFRTGFNNARLFPTEGKARQNCKVNAHVINVERMGGTYDDWFEFIPITIQEPPR